MKVLKEGKAHKKWAWFGTCDFCETEVRIFEGDGMASREYYNCDSRKRWIKWICPVCLSKQETHTSDAFGGKANGEYKEILLTKEDREEMELDEHTIKMEALEDMSLLAWIKD